MSDDVSHAIAQIVGVPDDEVTPSASLGSDLGLDLFDTAELVDELERLYNVRIPDAAYQTVETVEDVELLLDDGRDARGT